MSEYGHHKAGSAGSWEASETLRAPAPGLLPVGSHCMRRKFYPWGKLSGSCSMRDLEPFLCCCCWPLTDPEPHRLTLVSPREAKDWYCTEVARLSRNHSLRHRGVVLWMTSSKLDFSYIFWKALGKDSLKIRTSFKNLLGLIVSL